jgi:hypothetical protein
MKKSVLAVGISVVMLAACGEKEAVQKEKPKAEPTATKVEKVGKVVEGREYTVTAIKNGVLSLEDSIQGKKENAAEIRKVDIVKVDVKAAKRNGLIDVQDHVYFEPTDNYRYKATIVKDVVGEIKYDGTIKYKIIEVTDKAVKWLPLHGENNGGNVPPDMIQVTNGNGVKVGNIVTIKELAPVKFELTIEE